MGRKGEVRSGEQSRITVILQIFGGVSRRRSSSPLKIHDRAGKNMPEN